LTVEACAWLTGELAAKGCLLVCLREQLDLTTAAGRLMLHVLGALAEFERAIIRERVRSGIARAREQGTRSGRPIGRPGRAVDVDQVKQLRSSGESWRKIARRLHVPRRTLVRAWLDSGRPRGKTLLENAPGW